MSSGDRANLACFLLAVFADRLITGADPEHEVPDRRKAETTGPEYCIGYMYADEKADLLDISSWTKQKTPALTSENLVEEYGPGHNSFTVDEDGNTIFVYHSRPEQCFLGNCGYGSEDPLYDPCRSAHLRKVIWDENGLPVLNAEPYDFN